MKEHLESPTNKTFKGTSKTIQNELLQCMLDVCRDEIKLEIERATFLAVICDETTDVSNHAQLTLIFRYIDTSGNAVERFWGFFIPPGHKAKDVFGCIKSQLEIVIPGRHDKLVAQSYDGAAVMSGEFNGVQALVKQQYVSAHYIHCEAHKLNLVMERAVAVNTKARRFFADLHAIPKFFAHSSDRLAALDAAVAVRVPHASLIRWNSNIRTVEMIHDYREPLLDSFIALSESPRSTQPTVEGASHLIRVFKDPEFNYWLNFFHLVMPHVEILYNQLQSRQADAVRVNTYVSDFIRAVQKIRDDVSNGTALLETRDHENEPRQQRHQDIIQTLKAAALEVCDLIVVNSMERFKFTDHLEAASLLFCSRFKDYNNVFPEQEFQTTIKSFPQLQEDRLKKELKLLYNREDFRSSTGAIPLLKTLLANNLDTVFREVVKLLKIVCTMPMTTAEAERSFSTLKRIKTFLRNTMAEDRLSALAMLSIEKQLIARMDNFVDRVISKFIQLKDRRMDFVYKKA